jgi:hypothetical protein
MHESLMWTFLMKYGILKMKYENFHLIIIPLIISCKEQYEILHLNKYASSLTIKNLNYLK